MAMNWRVQGRVPLAFWTTYLDGLGSPLANTTCWIAAGDHSRFLLAVLIGESKAGTHFNRNRPENRNALNLRPPLRADGTREPGDYMSFAVWADGIQTGRERITSPTYGSGIYAETVTVLEFAHVWAPRTDDNDPDAFAAAIEERIDSYPREQEQPMAGLVFGRVKHPPFQRKIVNNRYWNDLGPRRIVGVGQHSMVGGQVGSYNYINGGAGQALWDYSVGGTTDGAALDGVIWMHNDPKANRSGWANGGSDGLEGDGPLFVRTLGIDAINRDIVSIERSDGGQYNTQPMSPKQFESICQLTAYYFDQARVPWDRYPFNPHVGCVTHMLHKEFATKDCPFPPVYNQIDRIQDRVRAIMKAAQTSAAEQPSQPPPTPIEQDHERYPNGWTAKELKARFGVLPRTNPRGSVTNLHFAVTKNPIASIANAWVARGDKEGFTKVSQLPKPQRWLVIQVDRDTKADVIWFEGEGGKAWTLYRPHTNVPWMWAS